MEAGQPIWLASIILLRPLIRDTATIDQYWYTMKKTLIPNITLLAFIIIFLYTGMSKLVHHLGFIYSIGWLKMLRPVAGFISYFIPILEIVIALLMFFERYKKKALIAAMILMIFFVG